jgi:uncharacterized protein YutE (UPF0331/DUF86 family)
MVDPLRLRALLERLDEEITDLERLAGLDAYAVLGDRDRLKSVKYGFVVAIEICIDIGNHIIASEGYRAPHDYGDVFAVLAEHGHLQDADVPTYAAMAGFRNLLVHGYARVDDARVVDILHERIDDLRRFGTVMAAVPDAEAP